MTREKINVAELLKDCPQGMELDCAMFEDVVFDKITDNQIFPICIKRIDGYPVILTKYGGYANCPSAKCVILPKGKTTWEGFVPPCKFKDGDIVYIKAKGHNHNEFIIIFKEIKNDHIHKHACFAYQVLYTNPNAVCHLVDIEEIRIATDEEKQKLFDTIKANGYKWNSETNTLEKLVEPMFKVGDIVRSKNCRDAGNFTIVKVGENKYSINLKNYCIEFKDQDNYELVSNKLVKPKFKVGDRITNGKTSIRIGYIDNEYYYEIGRNVANRLFIKNQDEWNLVPNKFDINTLKPFDRVLVRLTNNCVWMPKFFSYYDTNSKLKYYPFIITDNIGYPQCIPYEKNEYLSNTTEDCDEYYKTWK